MNTLLAIWQLSIALCGATAAALVLILLARLVSERRELLRRDERRRVAQLLMNTGLLTPALSKGWVEKETAAQLILEMAELVRGPDRDALLANAEALRIRHQLWQHSIRRNPQERLLAAEALAMFPLGRARVREMLRDRNSVVRLGAALALAQNEAAPAASEVVRRLGLGTTERSLLINSLMRDLVDADPGSVEQVLNDVTIPDAAKLAAVGALAASGRVEHAPLVARMAEDAEQDSDLLPRIYHALGRIGHPSGHDVILRGLSHHAWAVRAAAAQAAGSTRLTNTAGQLSELLGDEWWWVRFRAGEALWRLGAQGRKVLETAVSEGTPLAREAATRTLQERQAA